ncbi:uncharacterized protein [Ptychodera flava]|uniref:uncharacterized protein n=1 Tax=Ptychodera flava TaxID=63121 RepID=UPI00396A607D
MSEPCDSRPNCRASDKSPRENTKQIFPRGRGHISQERRPWSWKCRADVKHGGLSPQFPAASSSSPARRSPIKRLPGKGVVTSYPESGDAQLTRETISARENENSTRVTVGVGRGRGRGVRKNLKSPMAKSQKPVQMAESEVESFNLNDSNDSQQATKKFRKPIGIATAFTKPKDMLARLVQDHMEHNHRLDRATMPISLMYEEMATESCKPTVDHNSNNPNERNAEFSDIKNLSASQSDSAEGNPRNRKRKWNRSIESVEIEKPFPHDNESRSCYETDESRLGSNTVTNSPCGNVQNPQNSPEESKPYLHNTGIDSGTNHATTDGRLVDVTPEAPRISMTTSTPNEDVEMDALEMLCESYCPTDTSDSDSDYKDAIQTLSQEFSHESRGTSIIDQLGVEDTDSTGEIFSTPSKPLADMRIVTPRSEKHEGDYRTRQNDSQNIPAVWNSRSDVEGPSQSTTSNRESKYADFSGTVGTMNNPVQHEHPISYQSFSHGNNCRWQSGNERIRTVLPPFPTSPPTEEYHAMIPQMYTPLKTENDVSMDDRVPVLQPAETPHRNVCGITSSELFPRQLESSKKATGKSTPVDDAPLKESLKWLFNEDKSFSSQGETDFSTSEEISQSEDQTPAREDSDFSYDNEDTVAAFPCKINRTPRNGRAYELPPRFQKMLALKAKSDTSGAQLRGTWRRDDATSKGKTKPRLDTSPDDRNISIRSAPALRRKPRVTLASGDTKSSEAKSEFSAGRQNLSEMNIDESVYKKQWTSAYERYNQSPKLKALSKTLPIEMPSWRKREMPDFLPRFVEKTPPFAKSTHTAGNSPDTISPSSMPYYKRVQQFMNSTECQNTRAKFGFVDTHCHIDYMFTRLNYKGTFTRFMQENHFPENFNGCVAVFCDPDAFYTQMWKGLLKEDKVWGAFGIHPHSSNGYNDIVETRMKEALQHPRAVALGEIGLDYSDHCRCDKVTQHMVFERQLRLAIELGKPLVIHSRQAEDDTCEVLKRVVPRDYKIHRHCFTGTAEQARHILSEFPNSYIGLTALVTYQSAKQVHQTATEIPLDRILLETDAPFFLPQQIKKTDRSLRWSNPGMAACVAQGIAELKGITLHQVLSTTRKNARDMYGI